MRGNCFRTLEFGDDAAWLKERRYRIGSSEIAGILGMGYSDQTPYTIWLEKTTGQRLPKSGDFAELMEIGHAAEPFLREVFRIKTGRECHVDSSKTVRINDEFPAFAASLDGWCVNRDDDSRDDVVELKLIGLHMRSEYVQDELPLKFSLQVQLQMAVTGATDGWLFAMCGTEVILRHVPRHDRLIASMHRKAEEFLRLVETKTQPPADGNEATSRAISLYHGEPEINKVVKLPEEMQGYSERIEILRERQKSDKEEETLLKNRIRSFMGDAEWAYEPDGATFSWKKGKGARSFRQAKPSAVVRVHQVANGEF